MSDSVSNFLNFDFKLPSVTDVNKAAKFESQFIENCGNLLYCN